MLELGLTDNATVSLAALPQRLRDALASKANGLAAALQARIQQKLSGEVLNRRSGALATSLVMSLNDASGDVTARLATSPDVKYAAIHEFGGTIPPHEIVPDKAKTLAFLVHGKQVFAARVSLPAIAMPERSYMRSSLGEMTDEIRTGLAAAVAEATE